MARAGLNCTLSYQRGGASRAYRVRVSRLTMGFEMASEESQARAARAFYPYRTYPSQFSITVELIGSAERKSFNQYLMRYAEFILDPAIKGEITPQIRVTVPSRNFVRVGVPVEGVQFGARLGAIVWRPTVVFEVSREPADWDDPDVKYSRVQDDLSSLREPESKYFYPTGIQLHGDAGAAVQAAVNPLAGEIYADDRRGLTFEADEEEEASG